MRTEEHVLSLNQRTCSSVLLSYPSQTIPMFFCSLVLPLASNPHVLMFSCLTPRKQSPCSSVLLSYPSQAIPMFFCSLVLPLANNPHFLLFFCLILASNPHVLMFFCLILASNPHVLMFFCLPPKNMFFCLITMHIFLIPIKILNCFSLPFQISFILLYINILSLRKIENSIYTFYRNGTSTL